MNTYYSIVYFTLNAALDEKVSIGLLMSDGKTHLFDFSTEKLNAINKIADYTKVSLAKAYLKSLTPDKTDSERPSLFDMENEEWFSENSLDYLNRYSNNIIRFSTPKRIDVEFNPENFKKIFSSYIHELQMVTEDSLEINPQHAFISRVKEDLYPKIKKKVNLDIPLSSIEIPNLLVPLTVSILGRNHHPVAGQLVDFNKRHDHLGNDINSFFAFSKILDYKDDKPGTYYIIGKEPDRKKSKNKTLWKEIRDSKFLKFIDADQTEEIAEDLDHYEVTPYFKNV